MVNDITIIAGIIIFFITLGVFLPFIHDSFGSPTTITNSNSFQNELGQQVGTGGEGTNALTAWTVIKSVFLMFFFTFGSLPFWIDAIIFIPLRIILVVTIARNIWIGGGG